MNLLALINDKLDAATVERIGQEINAPEDRTRSAIAAALPLMVGQLRRNATAGPDSAESLVQAVQKDHAGDLLDNLGSLFTGGATGSRERMLDHVFGKRLDTVKSGVARTSGLDSGSVAQLMAMLGPVVMAALGKATAGGQTDQASITDLLSRAEREVKEQPGAGDTLMAQLLDGDGDGDVDASDLASAGMKLFSGFLKR